MLNINSYFFFLMSIAVADRFQNFYEQGERELLLSEVSELRNKVGINPLLLFPIYNIIMRIFFYPQHFEINYVKLLEALEAQENYGQSKFLSRRDEQVEAGRY